MNDIIFTKAKEFLRKYPGTIAWRVKAHCTILQKYINDDEKVLYVFAAQKGPSSLDIFSTHAIAVTDKRIIVGQKRLIFGHFYYTITPDMFNDFTIKMGLIWGRAIIDTIKETVVLSNLSRGALMEIETVLSKYMMQKQRQIDTSGEKTNEEIKQISN